MLIVGHLKEPKLDSDIRCDRASVLGNPFELVDERFRDEVVEAWRSYLKLAIRYKNKGNGALVVEPYQITTALPISKAWKRPTANQVVDELNSLVPLYKSNRVHRLMCWCRKSNATEEVPRCDCDIIILCVKKWSEKSA
ncbi:hypothetical protein [Pseudanabaena phage PA-SR01]|nr:hypothetical protein [Pseudanabaena phage PA-SR01]